jgi:ribose transport system permease protein
LFWALFSALAPSFTSTFNLFALSRSLAIDAVIGFSMMVVLAAGHMNLAIGSIGVCAVMLTGWLSAGLGLPLLPALAAGLAAGAALGWLNGWIIERTGVNSFIVTLATASLYAGLMMILTRAEAFRGLPPDLLAFGKARTGAVSWLLGVTAVVAVGLFVLFAGSALGRMILATGANPRAAELSGVPVGRVIRVSHALSGLLAALAGLMLTARLGAALPSIGGDWLLPSFLAPVLGGVLLSGGTVSIVGTFLGATLVTTIQNGLLLLEVGNFWIQFFLGLILLAAVMLDRYRSVLGERRRHRRP